MTGFSRKNDEFQFDKMSFTWFWEVKSVNNKAIDIKMKVPAWLDSALALPCKNILMKYFARGSFSLYLDLSSNVANQQLKINEDLLQSLTTKAIELYQAHIDVLQKPTTSELLAIKGVCETEDVSLNEEETDMLVKSLLASFEETCQKLQHDRKEEGEKIKQALMDILQNIASIVAKVDAFAKTQPEKLKARLQAQIDLLLDPTNPVSEDRLAQEVAMYVAKADIQEEVDRLKAHIATAQNLLALNEPVGRRLDFLCQELNREANTTCSKSCDIELTNYGMDLKTLIEQFREQVQNIE